MKITFIFNLNEKNDISKKIIIPIIKILLSFTHNNVVISLSSLQKFNKKLRIIGYFGKQYTFWNFDHYYETIVSPRIFNIFFLICNTSLFRRNTVNNIHTVRFYYKRNFVWIMFYLHNYFHIAVHLIKIQICEHFFNYTKIQKLGLNWKTNYMINILLYVYDTLCKDRVLIEASTLLSL